MFTRYPFIFVVLLLSLITGCGTSTPSAVSVTPIPTEKSVSFSPTPISLTATPTVTAMPPTNTPIHPTELPPTELPPTATPWPQVIKPGPYDIRALLLLPNDVGPNWYLSEDNYELYGWDLTLAGARESIPPCTSAKNFYNLQNATIEFLIPEIEDIHYYHAMAIMPASKKNANPYGDLLDNPELTALIQRADEYGLGIYATCGGVRVLAAADILNGKSITGEPSFQDEYTAAGAIYVGENILPVIDENLVTTQRGLYYNIEDSEALAVALENTLPLKTGEIREADTITHQIPERNTSWTQTFGGTSAEGARAIQATSDGGFILVGYTFSFGAGFADVYLVKLDSEGNLEWSNTYGGPGWEYGNSVAETPDDGYIIAGYTTSMGAGSRDVYLVKTDRDGKQIWAQAYGGADLDMGNSVAVTPDGGYIVAGYSEFFGAGENDVYLVQVDAEGNETWSHTFGGEAAEMGMSVLVNREGDYIVAGATGSFGASNRDFYLINISPQGNEIWAQTYGYGEFLPYEWGNSVIESRDGGYLIAGNSNVSTQLGTGELMNMYLVRTDDLGKEIWTSNIGRGQGYDYANAVHETDDGGFLVVGTTKSGSDNNDIYLIQVDSGGQVVWKKSFGDFGSEWASDVTLTRDGDILIVGHTNSFGAGSFDFWLMKVSPES